MIIWEWEFSDCVCPENWKLNCWSVIVNECVMSVRKKLQVWLEWSVCRDNYSHDDTNLSSSFPISCQTLPKDSNNSSDVIAVSSNPQLPIQTRTPVAPKCSRQLFLYENAWRFMFGRQNLDVKLFCVVTNVIWIYNPCFTIVMEYSSA